ncbi:hypothetical protein EPR50_G00036260 [Perca flavescens]|uniref:Apoptosis facilitator Bcl-2-like protein 14 n=2 Tax=Perca flavescens TaxID=8167 RepID=A0A484DER8_PERFV|nr:hypothetical protein EPR50_G00036260 [Perca flavescens]
MWTVLDLLLLKETSHPTMETQTETQRPNNGQLILVPHKDTIRLLEVYVKRSLSVNDGTLGHKAAGRKEKWVTMPRKLRRHSSDPSLHLADGLNNNKIGTFPAVELPTAPPEKSPEEAEKLTKKSKKNKKPSNNNKIGTLSAVEFLAAPPEKRPEEAEKPTKKSKKNKKPSLWKSFLDFFSRKSDEEIDEEQDGPLEMAKATSAEDTVVTCLPISPDLSPRIKPMRKKSIKRRFSKRGLSFTKPNKPGKDLHPTDITRVEAVVSVEPTEYYYEKVSEELEKIVHEVNLVQPLSNEEVIDRIINLTKEEGDAIDIKLKDNPTLNSFFQGMSYSSFQKLADAYLETEASATHNPPTVLPTAPELVKLAFTLDFTARIAGLSKQNIGHITGLGHRYLQDRFKYQQACTNHPGSNSDV